MIKQTIDLFRKEQSMTSTSFEVYNYSDEVPPKVFPHTHDFYEVYYLLSDQLTYMIDGREYQLQKGDFLMIPPGVLHYPSDLNVRQGNSYARIVLWISVDFFQQIAQGDTIIRDVWDVVTQNQNFHIRPTPNASASLLDCLQRLIQEQRRKNISTAFMSYAILAETLVNIIRTIHTMNHFEKHKVSSSLFSKLIQYIHTHLAEDLTLDLIASEFYISKSYVSKLFHEYMGVSVHQYIMMLRLEGCRREIESGIPITECMEMFGFKDYSAFYRAFKGAFQMSPREYQKAVR